jgi:hypothetical protein
VKGGRWEEADRTLRKVDEGLRGAREESELTEFPRGLLSYVPKGPKGASPGPEEDPLANRLTLLLRLLEIAPPGEEARQETLRLLGEARGALKEGDRRRAQKLLNEAHFGLESALPPRKGGGVKARRASLEVP